MSYPLASLFHGNITIENGCDTSLYGFGDLSVYNNAYINGTTNSTNSGNGSLVVAGGLGVTRDSNFSGTITVNSTSNL